MLELLDRASLIGSLPHGGIGAEIGVDVGGFSEVILERNQPRELHLIDCWHHQPDEQYKNDPGNAVEVAQDAKYQQVLRQFADRPHVHVLREYSVPAATKFPDAHFDWWYIDANHMQADRDLAAWWPKLKPGGWATGHDFVLIPEFIDVKPKVEKFAADHGLTIYVAGLQSTNVYERNYPSWAMRKP